jgi:3-hydroxyacyl-[acyl-carrier-protein] dehydratase
MAEDLPTGGVIDIAAIMRMIPHRYPFLLIDRVIDVVSGDSATGIKNVTVNEPFFPGHFPGAPVMPGVLIVEAMAQTAAVIAVHALGSEAEGKIVLFMSIDDCRFRRPVTPGDQLRLEVKKDRARGPVWRFIGVAKVDGQVVAEATFAAMIRDR